MSRDWLEAHLRRLEPPERRLFLKRAVHYADGVRERILATAPHCTQTGAELLGLALSRINDGHAQYAFRDGDICASRFICRCCLMAAQSLRKDEASAHSLADDTPMELAEAAALAYLQRRDGVEKFLAFVKGRKLKDKKLKGKLLAYCLGFAKYGQGTWDVERIAKDLRIDDPETVREYRSRLRELLEDFEVHRERFERGGKQDE